MDFFVWSKPNKRKVAFHATFLLLDSHNLQKNLEVNYAIFAKLW